MRKPFRLLIGVPTTDYIHADFVKSLLKLDEHLTREGIWHETEILSGSLVYFARNRLACKVINEEYTHLLFIDSDMVFDESIVETLMFSGKDCVCGAFQSRREPYGACVYTSIQPMVNVNEYGAAPFRVAGCGMAMTLISKEILKEVQAKYGTCFNPERIDGTNFGEDIAFCWRVNSIGKEIWCDPAARVGHIAHKVIWPGDEKRGG